MIKIVIADDHQLIREGIKKIIRGPKDMRVVGEASNINETLSMIAEHRPNIVVLDISLPGYEGLEGLLCIREAHPNIPVLILSMYPEERFAIRALKSGASGYITKAMAAEELISAIRKIFSGARYVSPRLAALLSVKEENPLRRTSHDSLTKREMDILTMLGAGKQVKQISAELSISISSVNTYRTRIFRKMGLSSNAALIRYVIENGLLEKQISTALLSK